MQVMLDVHLSRLELLPSGNENLIFFLLPIAQRNLSKTISQSRILTEPFWIEQK